eukprot:3480628-Amphidinium_carterae.1
MQGWAIWGHAHVKGCTMLAMAPLCQARFSSTAPVQHCAQPEGNKNYGYALHKHFLKGLFCVMSYPFAPLLARSLRCYTGGPASNSLVVMRPAHLCQFLRIALEGSSAVSSMANSNGAQPHVPQARTN